MFLLLNQSIVGCFLVVLASMLGLCVVYLFILELLWWFHYVLDYDP